MRYLALVPAALLALAACTQAAETGALQEPEPTPQPALYSPISRDALALGLPNLVGSNALHPATGEEIRDEEADFVTDSRVRQLLVSRGLDPSVVMVEQKSARISGFPDTTERVPKLAIAAAQVKDVPATALVEWDPTFYLLLTSVDEGDHIWQGEKPDGRPAAIDGHEVRVADFGLFVVGWYPYGDVLYVIVAEDDRTLEDAVERLPWSSVAT